MDVEVVLVVMRDITGDQLKFLQKLAVKRHERAKVLLYAQFPIF